MKSKLKIDVKKVWESSRGHRSHRSGSGIHLDKRTKRVRTRSSANRRAISDGY